LAEDIYRRLMVCCRNLGRRREALAVYDRLKQAFLTELNEPPSPENEEPRGTARDHERGWLPVGCTTAVGFITHPTPKGDGN